MAGLRAASIVESLLSQRPIKLHSLLTGSDEMGSVKSKEAFLTQQKAAAKKVGAVYLVTGEVQEWRYKTGIDGEPVVSYTIKVIHLDDDTIAFNAVGAKSGWGYQSIGVIAQEIAQETIPQFVP